MQLKEKKEFPYLESPNGDMYTSPFFSLSSYTAQFLQIKKKKEPEIHFPRAEAPYRKKEPIGKNWPIKNLVGARFYDPELGVWLTPDPAGQFFNPYSYGGDPINGTDPDGRCIDGVSTWVCLAIVATAVYGAYKGGKAGYQQGQAQGADGWEMFGHVAGGAATGAVATAAGAVTGIYTTAATGGCFMCGLAAGGLVSSGINSAYWGGRYDAPATLGVGPASYTFGDAPNSGFNMATFDGDWGSVEGFIDNSFVVLNYVGTAATAYGTYGSYARGSLFDGGLQNPMNANSQWSLVNSEGNLSLANFNQQSALSFQAAKDNINIKLGRENPNQTDLKGPNQGGLLSKESDFTQREIDILNDRMNSNLYPKDAARNVLYDMLRQRGYSPDEAFRLLKNQNKR